MIATRERNVGVHHFRGTECGDSGTPSPAATVIRIAASFQDIDVRAVFDAVPFGTHAASTPQRLARFAKARGGRPEQKDVAGVGDQ